jgi:hypothetical protein
VRSELLLRAVNERIVEIGANDAAALEILCECGDASCISTVAISVRDYERVRRDSSRFVVCEGHELADIERVNEVSSVSTSAPRNTSWSRRLSSPRGSEPSRRRRLAAP